MGDYLVLNEFIPGTKAKAQDVNANFSAVKDAINSKAFLSGDSTKTFSVAKAQDSAHAINKMQLDESTKIIDEKIAGLLNRFCLVSGNLLNGNADLLSYSGTTLSFKIGSGFPEFKWISANGSVETVLSLAVITGLSTNGIYSIIKELGSTNAVATSSNVTQGTVFPSSACDGDYHCLTSSALKTYKKVNGSWQELQYIKIGTVTVSGGVITSVYTINYNQNGYDRAYEFKSADIDISPNSLVMVNHNLGVTPQFADVYIKCISPDAGYSVGDCVKPTSYSNAYYDRNGLVFNSVQIGYRIGDVSIAVVNKTTGAQSDICVSKWKYNFVAKRWGY